MQNPRRYRDSPVSLAPYLPHPKFLAIREYALEASLNPFEKIGRIAFYTRHPEADLKGDGSMN